MKALPTHGNNPYYENILRDWAKRSRHDAYRKIRVKSTRPNGRIPRKRKKYITTIERKNFANLLLHTTYHLALERDIDTDGNRGLAGQAAAVGQARRTV